MMEKEIMFIKLGDDATMKENATCRTTVSELKNVLIVKSIVYIITD